MLPLCYAAPLCQNDKSGRPNLCGRHERWPKHPSLPVPATLPCPDWWTTTSQRSASATTWTTSTAARSSSTSWRSVCCWAKYLKMWRKLKLAGQHIYRRFIRKRGRSYPHFFLNQLPTVRVRINFSQIFQEVIEKRPFSWGHSNLFAPTEIEKFANDRKLKWAQDQCFWSSNSILPLIQGRYILLGFSSGPRVCLLKELHPSLKEWLEFIMIYEGKMKNKYSPGYEPRPSIPLSGALPLQLSPLSPLLVITLWLCFATD